MSIKLIALDLDMTTLDRNSHLPEANRIALEEASARGVRVVISTGRCYASLPREVTSIDGIHYAITSNGAEIRDLATDEVVYSDYIGRDALVKSREIIEENGYDIEVFVDGKAYMDKARWEEIREHGILNRNRDYIMNTRIPTEGILDFMMKNSDRVENINLFFEDLTKKPAIRETLVPLEEIATISTSFDANWEIGGKTTSKAGALKAFCKECGISMEEMMACGDSPNDIAMIEAAGIGVAMANAKDSVKAKADFISTSNDEGGVALAIRKFVL